VLPRIRLSVLKEQETDREKERDRERKHARNRERQSPFKAAEKHLHSELLSLQPCGRPESCSCDGAASDPLLLLLSLSGSLTSSLGMVLAALPLVSLLHPLPHAHMQATLMPLSPTSLLYFPGALALSSLACQASVMSDSGTRYLHPRSVSRNAPSLPPRLSAHGHAPKPKSEAEPEPPLMLPPTLTEYFEADGPWAVDNADVVKMSESVRVAPKAQFALVALMFTLERGQPRREQHEPRSWWAHANANATECGVTQVHPCGDSAKPIIATVAIATGQPAVLEHTDANGEWGERQSQAGGADIQASAAAVVQAGRRGRGRGRGRGQCGHADGDDGAA
jgi:hypothetical protein